jgi:hypothetical protein
MLKKGLKIGGYRSRRIKRAKKATNIKRFESLYGASPRVIALIWEDLQSTKVVAAHVLPHDRKVQFFLMALHHREESRVPCFDPYEQRTQLLSWF